MNALTIGAKASREYAHTDAVDKENAYMTLAHDQSKVDFNGGQLHPKRSD